MRRRVGLSQTGMYTRDVSAKKGPEVPAEMPPMRDSHRGDLINQATFSYFRVISRMSLLPMISRISRRFVAVARC
jgi:hypothetical protein